ARGARPVPTRHRGETPDRRLRDVVPGPERSAGRDAGHVGGRYQYLPQRSGVFGGGSGRDTRRAIADRSTRRVARSDARPGLAGPGATVSPAASTTSPSTSSAGVSGTATSSAGSPFPSAPSWGLSACAAVSWSVSPWSPSSPFSGSSPASSSLWGVESL